jgi:carbon starvation protein
MAIIIIFGTFLFLSLVYFTFAKRVERLVVQPSLNRPVPSRRYKDGKDFMPANPLVAFGYHFKTIGLDPIIGPVIAIQFGWLPAILWVFSAVLVMGWVQNYLVTIMSMRNKGLNLPGLAGILLTPRARKLLLTFVYLYCLLVMGGIGSIMTPLIARENVPVGFMSLVLAGILAGQMIYRWRVGVLLATLIPVPIALAGIYLGASPTSVNIVRTINHLGSFLGNGVFFARPLGYGDMTWTAFFWIAVILAFCYLGAVKPIWRFSQPINYTAFWFIALGVVGAIVGIILSTYHSDLPFAFEIPAFITITQPNVGPLWPILFITISCGAVSGWHSLVSTFSTSRQIEKETHTLPVTTGACLAQSILVIVGIIFAASLGVSAARFNPDLNYQLVAGPAGVFAHGMTHFLNVIGLPLDLGDAVSAVFVTVMALTVLQLVLRFMRMAGAELWGDRFPIMKNPRIGALVAIALSLFMIVFGFWQWTWVLFGGANQILAAIALLLVSVWLAEQRKAHKWTLLPAVFLFFTSMAALLYVSVYKALYLGILTVSEQSPGSTIGYLISGSVGLLIILIALNLFRDVLSALSRLRSRKVGTALVVSDQYT